MEASSIDGGIKLVSITSGAPDFSIKHKQRDAILRLLNLNSTADSDHYWQDVWKVLIFDDICRDILSPLLKVGELRKQGITLHLPLHTDRQSVPDVPAIYFVAPSKENIERICRDCVAKLYDSYYLNFSSAISRPLLEQLAEAALKAEVVSSIAKIYDQYLHFISLEDQLFSLNYSNSYVTFNDQTISDTEAEAQVNAIVDALFCVFTTLQQVPIIRCPRNSPAEMVAQKLNQKLHENTRRGSLFSETPSSFQRPVLILLDRNVDLSVMFHHTWTYQALVHDLLNMKLNTVKVNVTEKEKTELKTYDLDEATDSFWALNAGNPVPKVAEEIQVKLREYTSVLDEIDKLKLKDEDVGTALLGKTKGLGNLVSGITEHTEKKRLIDMHLNIATAIFDVIKSRGLDSYFSLEEALLSRGSQDKNAVLSAVAASSIGTPEDKLRLVLLYYMLATDVSNEDIQRFEEALQESGANVAALKYLKKIKAEISNSSMSSLKRSLASPSPSSKSSSSGLMRQGFSSISSLFQTGVNSIKMWIPSTKDLYVTKIVDAIMEIKNIPEIEEYCYFDPKIGTTDNVPRKVTPFKEAVVFMIGGGNYVEYQNLQDYAKEQSKQSHSPKQVIYGSTEILTANQFLEQLYVLGQQ